MNRKRITIYSGLILILLAGTIFAFEFYYYDRFYPNTFVGNMSVEGMTYVQVQEYFAPLANLLERSGLKIELISSQGQSLGGFTIPSSSDGLTPDTTIEYFSVAGWEESLKEAYSFGREGDLVDRIRDRLRMIGSREHDFSGKIYAGLVSELVSRETEKILESPADAAFTVDSRGRVSIKPEKLSQWVSPHYITKRVEVVLKSATGPYVPILVKVEEPEIFAGSLEPHLQKVSKLASSAVVHFNYGRARPSAPFSVFVPSLIVSKETGELQIRDSELMRYVENRISGFIENKPVNSRFGIENGQLVEIVPGRAGYAINAQKLAEDLNKQINSNESPQEIILTVETIYSQPQVTADSISNAGIKELVGRARTNFEGGSPDRRHNISLGAQKLSGLLIAPGQEFSTVESLGAITKENGFREELIIKGNATVYETGGGLCQIATTLFRAALNAGLKITERRNHSFVVGYYGAGLDATIYEPHPDLRFVNDTGYYLLLTGRVDRDEVVFEFYGTDDGRKVTISEPKIYDRVPPPPAKYIPSATLALGEELCTEHARDGMKAEAVYTVEYKDGQKREQIFKSSYRPWQKVCFVGVEQVETPEPVTASR